MGYRLTDPPQTARVAVQTEAFPRFEQKEKDNSDGVFFFQLKTNRRIEIELTLDLVNYRVTVESERDLRRDGREGRRYGFGSLSEKEQAKSIQDSTIS